MDPLAPGFVNSRNGSLQSDTYGKKGKKEADYMQTNLQGNLCRKINLTRKSSGWTL